MLSSQQGDIWSQSCQADIYLRGMSEKCQELEQISRSALLQQRGAGTDLSARVLGTPVAPTGCLENWHPYPRQDAKPKSAAQVLPARSEWAHTDREAESVLRAWEAGELNTHVGHQGRLHT